MTQNKNLKTRIRERMSLTGETYTTARKHLLTGSNNSSITRFENLMLNADTVPLIKDALLTNGINLLSGLIGVGKTTFCVAAINEVDKKVAFLKNVEEGLDNFIANSGNVTYYDIDEEDSYSLKALQEFDLVIFDEVRSVSKNQAALIKELSKSKPVLLVIHGSDAKYAMQRMLDLSAYDYRDNGYDFDLISRVKNVIQVHRYRDFVPGLTNAFYEIVEADEKVINSARVYRYNQEIKTLKKSPGYSARGTVENSYNKMITDSITDSLKPSKYSLENEIQILIKKGIVKEEVKQVSYYTMA